METQVRETIKEELEDVENRSMDRFESAFLHGTPEELREVGRLIKATDKVITMLKRELDE